MKIAIIIALLAVAGWGVYLYLKAKKNKQSAEEIIEEPTKEDKPSDTNSVKETKTGKGKGKNKN